MHNATVSVLTALHALSHRLAVTSGETAEIDAIEGSLTPELWQQTLGLLREAQGRDGPLDLDLGFSPLIYSWLGVADESAFVERFGIGVREALAADAARLYRVARAVDSPRALVLEAVRCQIAVTWCDRANLLLERLPETAPAAVEALEAALVHCPPDEAWHARLYDALAKAAAVAGDHYREVQAIARLSVLRGDNGPMDELARIGAARLLSILWCRSHGGYELGVERGLDPHVRADPALWRGVRDAIDAGCLDQIPIPVEVFVAWTSLSALVGRVGTAVGEVSEPCGAVGPTDLLGLLAEAAPDLGAIASAVEAVWSGTDAGPVDPVAGRYLAAAVIARRRAIEDDWQPLPGQPGCPCPWLEIYQGPRPDTTVERVALMELLHPVLVRSASYDLVAAVLVVLDRAALASARGEWEAQQIALRHAVSLTDQLSPTCAWFGYGRVLWALHVWRCGDADRALAGLRCVNTAASGDAIAVIGSKSDAGFAAARWDEQWQSEPSLETGSCAAWVHHHAGHVVRARELASEMTCRWPEDGGAWAALAGVLYAQARYRDAKLAVCTALKQGYDPAEGRRLLGRVEQALCVE